MCSSIYDCLLNVKESVEELSISTLNHCWKNVWEICVYNPENAPMLANDECDEFIAVSRLIGGEGFEDMERADLEDMFLENEMSEETLLHLMETETQTRESSTESEPEVV